MDYILYNPFCLEFPDLKLFQTMTIFRVRHNIGCDMYGHVERSNGAVKTAFDIQVNGKHGPGRPKMTWKQLTERDRREWKLSAIDPHGRDSWR